MIARRLLLVLSLLVASIGSAGAQTIPLNAGGVLIYTLPAGQIVYANRQFLEWTGYEDVPALAAAGFKKLAPVGHLIQKPPGEQTRGGPLHLLTITTRDGHTISVSGHLHRIRWRDVPAFALIMLLDGGA